MNIKPVYTAVGVAVTFSGLGTLASGATAFSSAIDNTSNLDADHLIAGTFTTAASGVSASGVVTVALTGSVDGGTTYATVLTSCTPGQQFVANANSTIYTCPAISVAAAFGGQLPPLYKVVVYNGTGAALTAGSMSYAREGTTIA